MAGFCAHSAQLLVYLLVPGDTLRSELPYPGGKMTFTVELKPLKVVVEYRSHFLRSAVDQALERSGVSILLGYIPFFLYEN